MHLRIRHRAWRAAAIAIGALAITGGIAYATIPAAADVIHGCYGPNGLLRVVNNSSGACQANETALEWNQTGPQGPAGDPGTAVAYASVGRSGIVNPDLSKNVAQVNVTHPAAGLYCFGGLSFTPKSVVVTPTSGIDGDGNPTFIDTIATATVTVPGVTFPLGCAETDTVRVRTVAAASAAALTDRGFMIWFED
jgi:hypothetical protein